MKNIFAENCFLDSPQLDTAFRIKNNVVRGGTLEDIYIRNMRVGQVGKQVEFVKDLLDDSSYTVEHHFQVIEVDFFYDEGSKGGFRPVLRDYVIENIDVIGGAPYSIYVRGYPDHPTTSYIGLTLRNISFTGLTNNPHYVLQDIDYVSSSDITVDGVLWNVKASAACHIYFKYEIVALFVVMLKAIN